MEFVSAGWANWLQAVPGQLKAGAARALRRTGTAVQATAVDLFRQRGVGRRLFGEKAKGARQLIQRGKLRVRHGVLEQPITLKGLAAIQERGGVIAAHVIRPKNAKALAFAASGGGTFFARSVNHPPSKYPAIPYAQRAVAMNVGKLQEELGKELQKLAGKVAA